MSPSIGPGAYDNGAQVETNTWNKNVSRGGVVSRGVDGSTAVGGNAEFRNSFYQDSDARQGSLHNVPFNSKIGRGDLDKMDNKFHPGPGAYYNPFQNSSLKYDFITK